MYQNLKYSRLYRECFHSGIVSSILLLVLVWWAWGGDGDRSPQFILTALAIASLIKEIWGLKKFHSKV